MSTSRQHAAPAGAAGPAVPETTLAERGRTLVYTSSLGMLSTHSRQQPGYPFGSVMPYAADDRGRPVFLISSMAMHTQNLKADARASLLVMQEGDGDPLGAARISLLGEVREVAAEETAAARERYLKRHANASYWVDFNDFGFFRLETSAVYFVGGFGVMGWVAAEDYAASEPDPLAESAAGIVRHMNEDHADVLVLLARVAGETEAESAVMTAVDRLGFHVRLRSGERVHGARIGFPREARDAGQARQLFIEMARAARVAG